MPLEIVPKLVFQCLFCNWRPPNDAALEAVVLHFEVEHNKDIIELEKVPVCVCKNESEAPILQFLGSFSIRDRITDRYLCRECKSVATLKRRARA